MRLVYIFCREMLAIIRVWLLLAAGAAANTLPNSHCTHASVSHLGLGDQALVSLPVLNFEEALQPCIVHPYLHTIGEEEKFNLGVKTNSLNDGLVAGNAYPPDRLPPNLPVDGNYPLSIFIPAQTHIMH